MPRKKKIALVADWITHWGGAERVFAKLMEMYPDADIYTSVFFPDRPEVFAGRNVYTSFLQHIPYLNRRHKLCMLLRPFAFSRFNFRKYDLVISSSSAEAKGIRTGKGGKVMVERGGFFYNKNDHIPSAFSFPLSTRRTPIHICYCHTPTRYLWSHSEQYKNFLEFGALNWLAKLIIPIAFRIMKKSDYRAAQRPTVLVANSRTTQARILEYYQRESQVVYPFYVNNKEKIKNNNNGFIENSDTFPPDKGGELAEGAMGGFIVGGRGDSEIVKGYYVCLGRIVPYKRFDLAIEVCSQLNLQLKIFTNTRNAESERLQKLSGPTIEWIFDASDAEVADGLAGAQAFIMPQEEDFGIVSLEAMSHGTPVIAYGKGGATETVVDGVSGILFEHQTAESLIEGVHRAQSVIWDVELIKKQSMLFSEERFEKGIRKVVEEIFNKRIKLSKSVKQ